MNSLFRLALFAGLLIAAACSGEQGQTATNDARDASNNQDKPDPRYAYDAKAAGELLQEWVDSTALTQEFPKIDGKKMAPELYNFYQSRNFSPAWGVGSSQELLDEIGQLDGEGLNSNDFPLDELQILADSAKNQNATAETGARLDLLLSASYLKLADLLATGKIKAAQLSKEWHIKNEAPDTLVAHLRRALSGQVGSSLTALRPGLGQYSKLRRHLADYRKASATRRLGGRGRRPRPDAG